MPAPNTCGRCGTANPPTNRFCEKCGAALAAPEASVDSWLSAAPDAPGQPDPQTPSAPQEVEYDLPAWLRDAADARPEPRAEDLQGDSSRWSFSPAASSERVEAPQAADDDLPAWLRSPAGATRDEPGAGRRDEPSSPAWLAGLGTGDTETPDRRAPAASGLSGWLRESDEPAGAPDEPAVVYDLPSWLTDDSANVPAARPPDAGAPTRFSDQQAGASSPSDQASAAPDWLRGDDLASSSMQDDAPPAWLQDTTVGTRASVPPTDASAESGTDRETAETRDTEEVPSWLADLESTTTTRRRDEDATAEPPSWLRDPVPEPSPPDQPTGQGAEDDLPDWLRAVSMDAAAPPAPGGDADGSGTTLPQGSQADQMDGTDDYGLPEWLRADAPPEPPQTSSGLPDWLADLEPPPSTAGSAGTLPSWLETGDDATASGPDSSATGAADAHPSGHHIARTYPSPNGDSDGSTADAGTPPWLAEIRTPAPPSPESRVPPWLSEPEAPAAPAFDEDVSVTRPAPAAQPSGNLPPWLADLEPARPAPDAALPPWLSDAEASPPAAPEPARESPENPLLGSLDLPTWLQDTEAQPATAEPQGTVPAWLQDLETDATVTAMAPALATPPPPVIERSPERIAATQLLERILNEPAPEPPVIAAPLQTKRSLPIVQIVVFVLLLAIILAILLFPRLGLGLGAPVSPPAMATQLLESIAALPAGAPVLVAYEWDLRRAAEMEPLEAALVEQLVTRRTPLILMTTDPQGALLTRRRSGLLRERADNFYDQAGLGFVDLGYKPGGPLALARMVTAFPGIFAQDWAGRNLQGERTVITAMCQSPTGDSADCRLDRLGMVVVLADESEDVRLWVEQVGSAQRQLPLAFATPAGVVPQVEPYLTSSQLILVAGLDGALALQGAGTADDWLGRRADATAVGKAVFGMAVLLGMGPAVWSGRRARRLGKAG